MVREAKIRGRVETAVDERELRRSTSRIKSSLESATNVVPSLDANNLQRRLERMVPGGRTAGRAVREIRRRRGGDDAGGDEGRGRRGSDGTDPADRQRVQQEQLRELRRIRRTLAKDAVTGGDGGGGTLRGLVGGAGAGLLAGGGGLSAAAGTASGALSGAVGAIGGALGGAGGGAIRGIRMPSPGTGGFGLPAPSSFIADQLKEDSRREDEDKSLLGKWFDNQTSGSPMGGTTMAATGGTGRAGEVARAVGQEAVSEAVSQVDWPDPPDPLEGVGWPELPDAVEELDWPELPDLGTELSWPELPELDDLVDWPELPDLGTELSWPELPDLGAELSWPEPPDWIRNPLGGGDDGTNAGDDTSGGRRDVLEVAVDATGIDDVAREGTRSRRELEGMIEDYLREEFR